MTDAEYEATRARVLAVIDRWSGPMGVRWWQVTHEWERLHDSVEHAPASSSTAVRTAARTRVQWPYLRATIEWFLPALRDLSEDELEEVVVHEFGHILVNEMRWVEAEGGDNILHEERVVSTLERAFRAVRDAARAGKLAGAGAAEA